MGYHTISIRPYTVINIYINDLEDDISSKVLKFADDTKVFRKVTNDTDKQSLQDDLDKLVKWQMLFNFGKFKCIHIGHGNMDEEYKMGDAVLGRTTQEKDLGVTFNFSNVSEQCGIATPSTSTEQEGHRDGTKNRDTHMIHTDENTDLRELESYELPAIISTPRRKPVPTSPVKTNSPVKTRTVRLIKKPLRLTEVRTHDKS